MNNLISRIAHASNEADGRRLMSRREFHAGLLSVGGMFLLGGFTGCNGPIVRSQSPEESLDVEADVKTVGDYALPYGMNAIRLEAVGLVTGLPGTGSDPEPSPYRDSLLAEMRTLKVRFPERVLASPNTSLVLIQGYLRPGIQKGDLFDLEVRVPSQSETTSLRGGWLMETRLTQLEYLDYLRKGGVMGKGEGPLLVDPTADIEADPISHTRATILGGGVSYRSRTLGLLLKKDKKSIRHSQLIGERLNRRFHMFLNGSKEGVAEPKTDELIELKLHPRYKDNVMRFLQVVRATALRESAVDRRNRLQNLERQLLEPVTSAQAALRLEAIGKDGIPILHKGMEQKNREVQFYSAEALAYLDDASAAVPLAEAARNVPAFRVYALTALSAMNDYAAEDALKTLLDVNSAETRYGAFRALWAMNPNNAFIRGEDIGDQFSYHVLDTRETPMVHVTRSRRAEVVLFGANQRFVTPMLIEIIDGRKQMVIDGRTEGQVTVSCFAQDKPDQRRTISDKVDDVIRTVVELGASYPDVVHLVQSAKKQNALTSRFEIEALPQGGRSYDRERDGENGGDNNIDGETAPLAIDNPLPDLFGQKNPSRGGKEKLEEQQASENNEEGPKNDVKKRGGFARLFKRSES